MTQRKLIKVYTKLLREMNGNFQEIFEGMFSHRDNPLFEYDENGAFKTLEFYEVKRSILRVSKVISETFDKNNGDYIGLICENPIAWTIGFWAILACGFKPFLVNQKLPKAMNEKLLKQLPISGVFIDGNGTLDDFGYPSLDYSKAIANQEKIETVSFADEMALSTSGTSGQEKIVFYSGKQIFNQLKNSEKIIPVCKEVKKTYQGKLKLLLFLPLYHIFGLIAIYFWFGFFGQTIVLLDNYSPDTILSTIKLHGVTHIFAVPLLWHSIEDKIKESVQKEDEKTQKKFWDGVEKITKIGSKYPTIANYISKKALHRVRCQVFGDSPVFCISGGSYIRTSTLVLMNALGYHLRGGYGASEIGITSVELSKYFNERNLNSVGRPLDTVQFRIVDGTLWVKSESTCKGTLIDGVYHPSEEWFNTLDLAHVDETGRYYIDGRKTDLVINENGENVNPDAIEQKFDFSSYPLIKGFCVLGLGETNREALTLLLDIDKDAAAEDLEKIDAYVKSINETLPMGFKVVQTYRVDRPLKEEEAIKVSRSQLKKKITAQSIRLYPLLSVLAEGSDEEGVDKIIEIFSSVLHVPLEDIKGSSHFLYDLGGSSLDYYAILDEVSSRYGITIEFDPENPLATPNDFARLLNKKEGER